MTSYIKPLSAVLFCLASVGTYAHADTVTDLGTSYSLSYKTTTIPNQYAVALSVDTSGFRGDAGLRAVSLVLARTDGSNVAASSGSYNHSASGFNFATGAASVSASGCDGTGSGYCFATPDQLGAGIGLAQFVYMFDFLVTLPNNVMLSTAVGADQVRAVYLFPDGLVHSAITSKNITLSLEPSLAPVPEPSTLLLMSTGLLGLGLMWRRRIFSA
jgi:hypothetical protein